MTTSTDSLHWRHDMRHRTRRSWTVAVSRPFFLMLLSSLLIAVCGAALTTARQLAGSRVYSVAQVQRQLARDARGWLGRTILVRGMVAGEPAYHPAPSLVAVDAAAPVDPLPLAWAGVDPLRTYLRRLPVLDSLAPPTQAVRWGVGAVYRIRLRAAPAGSCAVPPCYQALLLDAAPAALLGA
jgi:hypothetical protein